jgi:predicted RNase H-like nuclease (RuvC/YqgF family)
LRRGEDGEHLRVIADMTTCPENGIVSPRLRKLQGKIERMEAKIQQLEERVMEAERKIKLMATSKEEVKR